MQSALLQKDSGGLDDVYSFTLGETCVEVLHYEGGEYRSDCLMTGAEADTLWKTLRAAGYNDNGVTLEFVPDEPDAIVGASDSGCRMLVAGLACVILGAGVWASAIWALMG